MDPIVSIFKIVPAGSDDFDQICTVLQHNKLVFSDLDPRLAHFFKATSGLSIVGCIGLELYGSHGLLRSLWVDPAQRRQGLAASLVHTLEEYAVGLNLSDLYLLTETAEAFFSKRGYRRVERYAAPEELKNSTEFKSLCPDSAALMVKTL